MRLDRYLTEALDSPYTFKSIGRNVGFTMTNGRKYQGWSASFVTDDGNRYEVFGYQLGFTKAERETQAKDKELRDARRAQAEKEGRRLLKRPRNRGGLKGGIWEVHFALQDGDEDKFGITGTGDAFRVFATVFEFVKQLAEQAEPEYVAIIAKTGEGQRAKLYETLVKRKASKLGYEYVKTVKGKESTRIEVKKK